VPAISTKFSCRTSRKHPKAKQSQCWQKCGLCD